MAAGGIWSDAKRIELGLACEIVGMSEIKRRRLEQLEVKCHPGTKVGQYVPFYFCPRSVMLYILHRGNHPELSYHGGQRPMLHLQADLRATVGWAAQNGHKWAFSDANAGAFYADFFNRLDELSEINWNAVAATDFREAAIKDGKQAEFLVFESFPWELVERIGVVDRIRENEVRKKLEGVAHQPIVAVEAGWYYQQG